VLIKEIVSRKKKNIGALSSIFEFLSILLDDDPIGICRSMIRIIDSSDALIRCVTDHVRAHVMRIFVHMSRNRVASYCLVPLYRRMFLILSVAYQ